MSQGAVGCVGAVRFGLNKEMRYDSRQWQPSPKYERPTNQYERSSRGLDTKYQGDYVHRDPWLPYEPQHKFALPDRRPATTRAQPYSSEEWTVLTQMLPNRGVPVKRSPACWSAAASATPLYTEQPVSRFPRVSSAMSRYIDTQWQSDKLFKLY